MSRVSNVKTTKFVQQSLNKVIVVVVVVRLVIFVVALLRFYTGPRFGYEV